MKNNEFCKNYGKTNLKVSSLFGIWSKVEIFSNVPKKRLVRKFCLSLTSYARVVATPKWLILHDGRAFRLKQHCGNELFIVKDVVDIPNDHGGSDRNDRFWKVFNSNAEMVFEVKYQSMDFTSMTSEDYVLDLKCIDGRYFEEEGVRGVGVRDLDGKRILPCSFAFILLKNDGGGNEFFLCQDFAGVTFRFSLEGKEID